MLSKEVVEARFGHMPVDSAEARNMVKILIAEMTTDQVVKLIAKIKATQNKTSAFVFGLQVAREELTRR